MIFRPDPPKNSTAGKQVSAIAELKWAVSQDRKDYEGPSELLYYLIVVIHIVLACDCELAPCLPILTLLTQTILKFTFSVMVDFLIFLKCPSRTGKIRHTVKKGSRVSRPQPGCHYQTLPGR
jgi:hypothetical protein